MKIKLFNILGFIFIIQLIVVDRSFAQQIHLSPDELFNAARAIPKEKANYPKIISTLKLALQKSPNYADAQIFLGRVYTWNNNLDSARYEINQVLAKDPKNIEAYAALTDLEYWNQNFSRALDHANQGLLYDPKSSDLIVKKTKILAAMKDEKRTKSFYNEHKDLDTLRGFLDLIKRDNTKNMVSLGYEYVYFDKRFSDPWHFSYADYSRNTKIGYVSGRLWYSNRYNQNGLQGEVDAYPILSDRVYTYICVGASPSSIFPKFRAGGSIYFMLPKTFDGEMGFRYLNFNPVESYIAVLGLGKYIKNWYINVQSYISLVSEQSSQSHTLNVRYYFSDRFNLVGMQLGTGISPDDRIRNIDQTANLKSYKLGLNYSKDVVKNLAIAAAGLWYYEEYASNTWGNQFSLSLSINKRF
jgi:YaiO family outer membrane protein